VTPSSLHAVTRLGSGGGSVLVVVIVVGCTSTSQHNRSCVKRQGMNE